MGNQQRLLLVGNRGETNIGESLLRASRCLGYQAEFLDIRTAFATTRWLQRLSWHLAGHRPVHLRFFSSSVERSATVGHWNVLISTGVAPVTKESLAGLKARGVRCLNYSTDDPWSAGHRAKWFLRALPAYDRVFTTRRSNIEDFAKIGAKAAYLPFGYDSDLFYPVNRGEAEVLPYDLLFVGGADDHRARLLHTVSQSGLRVALYGDYWKRYSSLSPQSFGRADVLLLRKITSSVPINLCLCRRSNRDGHVMRSFEIPALEGFMIAEDTLEHRELFGEEGKSVLYFANSDELIEKANWALAHPEERRRMAMAAYQRIVGGKNTYRDRLVSMLSRDCEKT